jgi:hypothetical protein
VPSLPEQLDRRGDSYACMPIARHRGNEYRDDLVAHELVDDGVVPDEDVRSGVVEATHQPVEVTRPHALRDGR